MPNESYVQKLWDRFREAIRPLALGKESTLSNMHKTILDELNSNFGSEQLLRRIELCQKALEIISRRDTPELWGKLQDDLACSLVELPDRLRANNIEQAIFHFEQALEVRTCQKFPKEWAMTQNNLATAYRERICGRRSENLKKAIELYTQALKVRTIDADPVRWAMTQLNLAGAFYKRYDERAESLETAILHANQALSVYTRDAFPHYWAQMQNTLGEIYRVRIRGSKKENIEQAIWHFNQALEVHKKQTYPGDWAMAQQNLGAAYITRTKDGRAKNAEWAIYHCRQALEVYTYETFPQYWASIQDTLGIAYRDRIHGDQIENIEQAIAHFHEALQIRTLGAFPEDWARTQGNLGTSYLARISDEREKDIEQAICYFQDALKVFDRQAFPEDWARVHNNLGNAYLAFVQGDDAETVEQQKYVEMAIENYEQALLVRTIESFPEDWAETQSNLAGAERTRATDQDLEHAITHLQAVLTVYTPRTFPQYWARTHSNLAVIYSVRKQGEPAANIQLAIEHYQKALKVFTPQSVPEMCLNTARGLGNRAFDRQDWGLASTAYTQALAAQDVLMQTSFSLASGKAGLAETQNLSPRTAYAFLKSATSRDGVKRAVEVLEKGRAQLLRESFEYQQRNLERLSSLGYKHLYDDYIQARNAYRELQGSGITQDTPEAWDQALEKVQATAIAIRNIAGRKYPQYRYFLHALDFDEIQEQTYKNPLVYLCATSAGGLALIVNQEDVQVFEIPELEADALQKQIWRPSNEEIDRINNHLQSGNITLEDIKAVKGGYFSTYALWSLTSYLVNTPEELKRELFNAWQETLDETTHWLWDTVMGKIVSAIKEYSRAVVLIPAGQLSMLPLHAAWTEDPSKPTKRRYVLDELGISYAPSAHALWQASQGIDRPALNLLAVDNPDGSLLFSKDEVRVALSMFKQNKHLAGENAISQAVKQEMLQAHVLHFSTHGRAGWEKAEQAQLKLYQGDLKLPEIFDLDLNQVRLAVLSACETGVPGLELIDEMIGLPAGMLQAGVAGVVGSLWSVSDRSTAMLMAYFYSLWRAQHSDGNLSPQESLRQAQIWLRDSATSQKMEWLDRIAHTNTEAARSFYEYVGWDDPDARVFESPFFWAAFTYTGV